jgi:DNA ligase (NAD+)
MNSERIKILEVELDCWNEAYRYGEAPIVSDAIYDEHLEELAQLDPNNIRVTKVGLAPPDDERKENLPIYMASMNKVKSYDELKAWMKKKNIPLDTIMCISPKYDGLSILNNVRVNNLAWTRGDGAVGQNSIQHFTDVVSKYSKSKIEEFKLKFKNAPHIYTTGEAIMTKEVFQKNHADKYDNGRNRVSGLFNKYKKENNENFNDTSYMRYGLDCGIAMNKSEQLNLLNEYFNSPKVPYILAKVDDLSTDYLKNLFLEWVKDFEIDGLIIEVDDSSLRSNIKAERSTKGNPNVMNPGYARAYKASFEEEKDTKVTGLILEVSKLGNIIPVAEVEPIMLDGAEVTHVTCNNAKMIHELGIGKNAIIRLKRSGMVIPYIVDVIKKSDEKVIFPTTCPCCGTSLIWNETATHLVCTNDKCSDRIIKQITSFFDILEVKGVRESTFRQLYNAGYDSIEKIIAMSVEDYMTVDRMGNTKSSNTYDAIQSKISGVTLSKLQHASGFFSDQNTGFSLGSKKLILLENFTEKPSVSEVTKIDGFSDSSALIYVNNYDRFFSWIKTFPITIKKEEVLVATGNSCVGNVFIFSGVRRKDLELLIKEQGGNVVDSMSKNCTHLIMKSIGSGSSKETKALEYGMTIWTVVELEKFLNK